jgi:hypothetical protein
MPERTAYRRKDLFWLMVSEVLGHDQLDPLFLGCSETEHHGGRAWWYKVAHLMVPRKQRG